jgi:hypothetical protein
MRYAKQFTIMLEFFSLFIIEECEERIEFFDFAHGRKFDKFSFDFSSSAFTLVSIFAYYCGYAPDRPSNSIFSCFFGRRGVHSRLHTYTCVGYFALPWHSHSGRRNLSFSSHSDRPITSFKNVGLADNDIAHLIND